MSRLQLPRQTSTFISTYTPNEGELFYDTTNDELKVDVASAVGGKALAFKDGSNLTAGASLVAATGGTTALTLAARYGRMLTPEDFGAVGDNVTDDATALAAWLACGDKYLQARGSYKTSVMLTIPADVCVDAMGASFTPTGNIDVIRMHGAAKLLGYPHIDVSGVGGWNSAALLFDGSSYAVAANQFLLYRPTIAQVRLTGVTTGTGNGVGVYFKTVDDTVNNQWIQGVVVHAIGRGFDKALYMVKDGASGTRTFVNSNTVVMEWGAPYQTVVLESDHASSYGVDGNKIFFRAQSRDSSEQNAVPLVLLGQYNDIEGVQWDWVGGGGGTQDMMTLQSGARKNKYAVPTDPSLYTDNSGEWNDLDLKAVTGYKKLRRSNATDVLRLAGTGASSSVTGTTSETTLATVTIPADSMGPNGFCRITSLWSYTNNANSKTLRVKFGGTAYVAPSPTATASLQSICTIYNRNSAASQVGPSNATATDGAMGTEGSSPITSAVDTSNATTILLTGQLANSADTITLEGYLVEIAWGP